MKVARDGRGLGRGLSALLAEVQGAGDAEGGGDAVLRAPIESIVPNPDQPRRRYDPEALAELAGSIRARGVLQPLIVRRHPAEAGLWQIVAGERRWRAAQMAQVHELPVIVREFDDAEVAQVALVENIQRADLNAIEEAAAIGQLMERYGHSQEELADVVHKSRSHVANLLRLLTLPDGVQAMVMDGRLTAGHARALITAPDPEALARRVAEKGLSVRETEALAARVAGAPKRRRGPKAVTGDADTKALAADLSAALGMKVSILHFGPDGSVDITYRDLDELDRICRLLTKG